MPGINRWLTYALKFVLATINRWVKLLQAKCLINDKYH